MTMRVALVGGPMYDTAYERFAGRDIEVVLHADHPTLNRRVAEMLAAGEQIDVLSTHGKYAPSQAEWLRPLDDLLDAGVVGALSPAAVELCRVDGRLLSVPRVIDVRIMWVDPTQLADAPSSWDDVVRAAESGHAFGMPGRESGLFGTFFELIVGAGGRLLSDGASVDRDVAAEAVETLRRITAAGPDDLVNWHYDEVDAALIDGRLAAAASWPGATGRIRGSDLALEPHPYPAGPQRRVTYSGCHSWAIPTTCGDVDGALDLVTELCGESAHAADASAGSVCANDAAFESVEPVDEIDARRLALTREAIADQMITYPAMARFPDIEDAGWVALREVLVGDASIDQALDRIESVIAAVEESP